MDFGCSETSDGPLFRTYISSVGGSDRLVTKGHTCDVCEKGFRRKSDLRRTLSYFMVNFLELISITPLAISLGHQSEQHSGKSNKHWHCDLCSVIIRRRERVKKHWTTPRHGEARAKKGIHKAAVDEQQVCNFL